MERRKFIKDSAIGTLGIGLMTAFPNLILSSCTDPLFFKISLAQWSLHRTLRAGDLTTLQFPAKAKNDFGIDAVEYVNTFFKDKAKDKNYLNELKSRSSDNEVKNLLIMIDGEGDLASNNATERLKSVENHYKWVEAAQHLGCHSIRVNLNGTGTPEELAENATKSLHKLATFAQAYNINVIVENHGKQSSRADWLVPIIEEVNLSNCGTLPDFGNFYDYDRYQGVQEMLPFAKGVSAKSNHFNAQGDESDINYYQMLQIVKNSGYKGYIGIEYEGPNPDEDQGIRLTKDLLIKAAHSLK